MTEVVHPYGLNHPSLKMQLNHKVVSIKDIKAEPMANMAFTHLTVIRSLPHLVVAHLFPMMKKP